jgi:hypothetical protein
VGGNCCGLVASTLVRLCPCACSQSSSQSTKQQAAEVQTC